MSINLAEKPSIKTHENKRLANFLMSATFTLIEPYTSFLSRKKIVHKKFVIYVFISLPNIENFNFT